MPAENLLLYRVWCVTEAAWVRTNYILESDGPPTTCPNNTNHTIDPSMTTIISTVPPDGSYDPDGNLLTVPEPRGGDEKYFYVPNLCDACTWYQEAPQVLQQILTTSDDQTYESGLVNWIDLTHGRVFREDEIPNQAQYLPVIEVDTGGGFAAVVENSWGATDNDYTVDYPAGTVTFNLALQPTDQVRASFYHAVSSAFMVEPDPGKRLKVLYVEVQFTKDVEMTADIVFDIMAYNPFDPATQATGTITVVTAPLVAGDLIDILSNLLTGIAGARTPGNDDFDASIGDTTDLATEIAAALNDPANSFSDIVIATPVGDTITLTANIANYIGPYGNAITLAVTTTPAGGLTVSGAALTGGVMNPKVLVKQERYKRLIDFFQESTGPFPVIPAFGGAGVRGIPSDVITIPFNYLAYRDMKSSQGVEMIVYIDGDVPMTGYFANATYYCLSESE